MWTRQSLQYLAIAAALGGCCASAGMQTMSLDQAPGEGHASPPIEFITDSVLADAAQLTGIARGALKVQSSESVVWPDGSLGCPLPDVVYTQALVPGYRIKLLAGDRVLDYHASAKGNFVLCPPARSTDPANQSVR